MKLEYERGSYSHWCPACEVLHFIPVSEPHKSRWEFNGDLDAPTFNPSVRHQWGLGICCHYAITAGQIQYHHDSTHSMAGKLIALPSLPE